MLVFQTKTEEIRRSRGRKYSRDYGRIKFPYVSPVKESVWEGKILD
jgi:hypothetical protein